jgi:hypothetical protein
VSYCSPNGTACYSGIILEGSCPVCCTGLYADASFEEDNISKGQSSNEFMKMEAAYQAYKNNYAKNLQFDSTHKNLSMCIHLKVVYQYTFSASRKNYPLKFVQIYFGTATYDKIERDEKVTIQAQLGLIGGTMGLLTGFSLLSAVEIIYFVIKFFLSLRVTRADLLANKSFKK